VALLTVDDCLRKFQTIRGPVHSGDPWVFAHSGGQHPFHVVIGSIIHGDEVGSLPAVIRLIEGIQAGTVRYGGRLTVFLGNPDAARAGRRFLEDDLNRVFVDDPPDNLEGRRARALRPVLAAADVFLDLHQTIRETDRPFYIFPFTTPGWWWARAIGGAETWVTRSSGQAFTPGACCADEYVRLLGRPGLTLELGKRGFTADAEARAWKAVTGLLDLADAVAHQPGALQSRALAAPELLFVETRWRCAFTDPRLRLAPGWVNFQSVQAGQLLSLPGSPDLVAPVDGMLLFPKYPAYHEDGRVVEPRPGEIVRIVAPLSEHPVAVWGG
jgi:succinylglutamate desuccinylase